MASTGLFDKHQDQASEHCNRKENDRGRSSSLDGCLRDGLTKTAYVSKTLKTPDRIEYQHRNGRGLNTTSGRTRRSANRHQDDGDKQTRIGQVVEIDRIETRRAAYHAVEEGNEDPFGDGCILERVIPLEDRKGRVPPHDQEEGADQHQLGVQRQIVPRGPLWLSKTIEQFQKDWEPEPAEDHEATDDDIDQPIASVTD